MSFYIPAEGPASWEALLGDPEKHWKMGRSARTLAHCWESAQGFPPEVSGTLDASPYTELHDLQFVAGFPEHEVPLPGGRRPSQTDVFVLATCGDGLVSIAVEGKVDEPFGDTVEVWLGTDPSPGKETRLAYLCNLLRIATDDASVLRYQLLHRTASAIIEAERFDAKTAVMLVHSWAPNREGFDDYSAFVNILGGSPALDSVTSVEAVDNLYVGWICGMPEWLTK
ncbi:MAG: hypothetical protein V3S38_04355 [Acidimicrobiia bacterium]